MKNKNFWKGFLGGILAILTILLCTILVTEWTGCVQWERILGTKQNGVISADVEKKLEQIQTYINAYYMGEADTDAAGDAASKGLVGSLKDDYAAYYSKDEYRSVLEKTEGNFCGIGAYVSQNATTGAITIVQPMKNSPAKKAGIKAGDVICKVDEESVANMDLTTVTSKMKGEPGTTVEIEVARKGTKENLTFQIVRQKIETDTVAYKMLDDSIGYIAVSEFDEVTPTQFKKALNHLEEKGEKSLIIDLRDNGGGLLKAAIDMLNRMLPKGVVVYTQDKDGKKEYYYSDNKESFNKPVVILVNENTASASEVFSGAMQDYEKAVLIGTKTFGKGIVQSVFNLYDGSAVKFTTSKYYTPKGRNIHGTGLEPDQEAELTDRTYKQKGSGLTLDSQVEAAVEYLKDK